MATQTLFNDVDVAELYARHRDGVDQSFIDHVADAIGPAGRLVDIGAGIGGPAASFRDRGHDVIAVEPSVPMISIGRRRYPDLTFVRAAGERLPFSDDSFDAATALYVLHHTDDPEAVLAEARRLVRPDGRIVVASGNADCARNRFFRHYFPTLAPDLPDHHEIGVYGRAARLRIVDVRHVPHWVYPNRRVDADYVNMVRTDMFAALRGLDPDTFDAGIERLRADVGRPIPPAKATLVVFGRT